MKQILMRKPRHGIYCYREIETGKIVYIGKDSKLIYNNRHLGHTQVDSKNKKQKVDLILQAHPERYVYEQVCFCDEYWLEALEETLIRFWKPKYNILLKED